MNRPSAYRMANLADQDAMILPHDANPGWMEFSERTGTTASNAAMVVMRMGRKRSPLA